MNLLYDTLFIQDIGLEAQHGEHDQRGQNRREKVDDGDEHGVKVTVVVNLIVTGEGYDSSEAQAQGEEGLGGCLPPHLGLQHLLQLGRTKREGQLMTGLFRNSQMGNCASVTFGVNM